MDPFLVFRRSGRTIAAVIGLGFGGGTFVLGVASSAVGALSLSALLPAVKGYFLVSLPFFAFGAVLAACRRELWVLPEQKVLRMLTFRPWLLRGPRVEQADLSDYQGLCMVNLDNQAERTTTAVALVPTEGDPVPVKEFGEPSAAEAFLGELGEVTGLPRIRGGAVEEP
ncbi:MAG: hypothetical protein R3B72_14275 [Polyangiaceae bacterium]